MCACLKEHMRVDCFALFAWFARAALLDGIVKLQQAKHATSAKHLVIWDWSVFKCSDTNVIFQTAIFLVLFVRNNKRSSGIDCKTFDCLSRNFLYYRYPELRFCY